MEKHDPVRVFLVDDHPLLRTGLRFTLDGMEDIDLIGEASDGFEGVEKILKDPPDIALIDIDLPGISGITVIEMVKKKLRDIKIIALSSYSEKSYVSGAMEAGADGYLLKAISITALVDFLREFSRGEILHPLICWTWRCPRRRRRNRSLFISPRGKNRFWN